MTELTTAEKHRIVAHFPEKISRAIVNYATEVALISSRYLFTRRHGSFQFSYCTHCQKEYLTEKLKHGDETICKKCSSTCKVKASGMGRKAMVDQAYFTFYEKSVLHPEAITARGILVARDYSGDYRETKTEYRVEYMYLFEPGNYALLENRWGKWIKRKQVFSDYPPSMVNKRTTVCRASIEEAVKGTPFQYSTWERYFDQNGDMIRFFQRYAQYPSIEYITKAGFQHIVQAKLTGDKTYGVINWRGKTLPKVMRLSKKELHDMKDHGLTLKALDLHYFHVSKKRGSQITMADASLLGELGEGYYANEIDKLLPLASMDKINRYILKQLRKEGKHYRSATTILTAWRDYVKDCQTLEMDVSQDCILFPNDLYVAHQKTIMKVKMKADLSLNIKIAARLPELQVFHFTEGKLFLRPARDSVELFEEGKALQHCVGGYAEKYAEGKSTIFLIRKIDFPETPYYTMEVIDRKIVQVYGMRHCHPSDEVHSFIQAFKAEKLRSRKSDRKASITA